jgi:catechol 2,3-dioxygenase-like lactoylglutathione lyase family enzyme
MKRKAAEVGHMVTHFDHVTIVVRDVGGAKAFFALLGFMEQQSVVNSGGQFSRYMGIPDIEAEHVTLALANAIPRRRKPRLPHPSSREIACRLLAD